MRPFRLPDPGEGLVEADIVNWRVQVGDTVKVNDIVVEVETSKSLVELPIPFAGTVAEILVAEGELVEVGTPIIVIDDGTSAPAAGSEAEADEGSGPNLVGYGAKPGASSRRARKPAASAPDVDPETTRAINDSLDPAQPVSRPVDEPAPLPAVSDEPQGGPLPAPGHPGPAPRPRPGVLAKPPVRKLAQDLGVDLHDVAGSGEDGIVTRDDVLAAAPARPEPRPSGAKAAGGDVRIPVRGVRKATAEAMVASAFTAPHVTEWTDIDVTATMELVASLKQHPDFAGVRVSPTLWIARAACLALVKHPALNSSWDADAGEIVQHGEVNLGVAAATPRGLLVPNIKSAQRLGLRELATELNQLVETAKQGRTQPRDTAGGTFTLTNVGVFGVDAGTPIINPGEGAILAAGAISRRPWVLGTGAAERVEPRWVMTLAVSFDHRMIDGEQGSLFLAEMARLLHQPALAMI